MVFPLWVQAGQVKALRFWTAPDHTRLVFDVSVPLQHQIFLLEKPSRLVIDLFDARLNAKWPQLPEAHPVLHRIRSAPRNKNDLRVVFDLKAGVRPRSFTLKPNKRYGHRLVIDLYNGSATKSASQDVKKTLPAAYGVRDVVIAIDAGHGGEDPGAIGAKGTREKDVVLAIAKKLEALIRKTPGMQPVMIRKGDYYISLRQRIQIAREARADLFVSIHADAFKNAKVRGSSVYTLSRHGASSEAARWLAARENAADLVGGVSLDDKDDLLASVLLDLSQTATLEASQELADKVLSKLESMGQLHHQSIQKAGFVVLKSPDIPSILIETAFISNSYEERKLRSRTHQTRLAQAIFNGIYDYFSLRAPAGTRLAGRKHTISRGETLSGIAQLYGISMEQLMGHNDLTSSRIQIGQVLEIPEGG